MPEWRGEEPDQDRLTFLFLFVPNLGAQKCASLSWGGRRVGNLFSISALLRYETYCWQTVFTKQLVLSYICTRLLNRYNMDTVYICSALCREVDTEGRRVSHTILYIHVLYCTYMYYTECTCTILYVHVLYCMYMYYTVHTCSSVYCPYMYYTVCTIVHVLHVQIKSNQNISVANR
jgi:hypothetical protein